MQYSSLDPSPHPLREKGLGTLMLILGSEYIGFAYEHVMVRMTKKLLQCLQTLFPAWGLGSEDETSSTVTTKGSHRVLQNLRSEWYFVYKYR